MGLKPLEFSDCLLDSPYFRDSIHDHEKDLDETNESIKNLIKECRNLIKALENLSKAQQGFSTQLNKFKLQYISETDVEDDLEYQDAFPSFAFIIEKIEEERLRMLGHAKMQLIDPLENFRREQIGHAKEEKKKFERETERVCSLFDNHLKQSPKKKDNILMEADAQLELELRNFRKMSMSYVSLLQEVNERKKFEIVEILLSFMYGTSVFFHSGHEVFNDSGNYLTELQIKLQKTREHFEVTKEEVEDLKNKTTRKFHSGELHKGMHARQGYLYVNDKKRGVLGSTWTKHYCMYTKENKILTMIPYTQTHGKLNTNTDTLVVQSCTRKPTELSDRRFLFEITGHDRPQPILLQSLSEEDRRQWLEVMDGQEPIYQESSEFHANDGSTSINDVGMQFVEKCIKAIEARGLDDQGLYRKAGVSSKFTKLLNTGLDAKQIDKLDLISSETTYEINTITSALKQYFRSLSEPLLTFKYHEDFVEAIKLKTAEKKSGRLKELLKCIPDTHFLILHRLMNHLKLVAQHSNRNLMQASNLGVVLGPTLMRPKEETMAAILGIKNQSSVLEYMIENYDELFPGDAPVLTRTSSNLSVESPGVGPSKSPKFRKARAPDPPSRPNSAARLSKTSSDSSGESVPVSKHAIRREVSENLSYSNSNNPNNRIGKPKLPALPGPKPRVNSSRFPESVSPFTSPHQQGELRVVGNMKSPASLNQKNLFIDEDDTSNRRESYALAMDSRVLSTSVDPFEEKHSPGERANPAPGPLTEKPERPLPARRQRSSDSSAPPVVQRRKEWKVRTKYNCIAGSDAELSFNVGAIITNVRRSTEDGWLMGTLNGITGLIPENYCEKMD